MTTAPARRLLPLAAVLAGCMTVNAGGSRRTFGPEWKPVGGGGEHERTVSVTFRHSSGNVAGFQLPLECGDHLWGHETDDNAGSAVEIRPRDGRPYGGFEVSKAANGKATQFTVRVGANIYLDLDADGTLDAMFDRTSDAQGSKILFEGKFIPVETGKMGFFGTRPSVSTADRSESYEFAGGRWHRVKATVP
jgi:hypothetical protein